MLSLSQIAKPSSSFNKGIKKILHLSWDMKKIVLLSPSLSRNSLDFCLHINSCLSYCSLIYSFNSFSSCIWSMLWLQDWIKFNYNSKLFNFLWTYPNWFLFQDTSCSERWIRFLLRSLPYSLYLVFHCELMSSTQGLSLNHIAWIWKAFPYKAHVCQWYVI